MSVAASPGTDPLALYGAVVATVSLVIGVAALGWQIYSWHRERQTRVDVEVSYGFMGLPTGVEEAVFIKAINRSGHPVNVSAAGLRLQDGSGSWTVKPYPPNGATLPGVIAPHDSGQTWWFLEEVGKAGLDISRPLSGRVNLSTGEFFVSKAVTLKRRE